MNEDDLYAASKKKADIVAAEGRTSVELAAETQPGTEVYLNDVKQESAGGSCSLNLTASKDGTDNRIELKKDGNLENSYTVTCYERLYDGMPDQVIDYLCMGAQYTNGNRPALVSYGTHQRAVATLRGGTGDAVADETKPPVSLGNFGGYITYYYKEAIQDDPSNPYGIDFIVYGNSVDGSSGFAEPGNVMVSEDGNRWYTLAGSLHYDDTAVWNHQITYKKESSGNASHSSALGSGTLPYQYPLKEYYPLFSWNNAYEQSMTLKGVYLKAADGVNEYGNTLPPYPAFGYADCGIRSDSNEAMNPYEGITEDTKILTNRTDGFDLAWAVDEQGKPVSLKQGIHYVKVQTASFIENGAIGEKSTEINMIRKAKSGEREVGKTSAPSGIIVDGNAVDLKAGVYSYNAEVNGIFDVSVTGTPEGANVYINSTRGTSANFKKAAHDMLRIIVQEGQKEPLIYYITVKEGEGAEVPATAVTFNANQGKVEGQNSLLRYYDKNSTAKDFPVPVREGYTFQGWYAGQVKYDKFVEGLGAALTLTAKWESNSSVTTPVTPAPGPSDEKKITVSFRLVGATRSKTGVDLSADKMDSQYVTWIATKQYQVPEGSTIKDVFIQAVSKAGLSELGASAGYVKSITAPSALGGYALKEKDNGAYSGWMYTLNGEHPLKGLKEQILNDGDEVVWHYVNDYRYEIHDWDKLGGTGYPSAGNGAWHKGWLKVPDTDPVSSSIVTPGADQPAKPADKVNTSQGTTTVPSDTTVQDDTAAAAVKKEDLAAMIAQAKKHESQEIVIQVQEADAKGAGTVQLQLPTQAMEDITEQTSAALTVETPNGNITLDEAALHQAAAQAEGSTVTIEIALSKQPTQAQQELLGSGAKVVDVTIRSGGAAISTFGNGRLKISVSIPDVLKGKKVGAVHVASNEKYEILPGEAVTQNKKDFYRFITTHLSTFALVDLAELKKEPVTEPTNPADPGQADAAFAKAKTTVKLTNVSRTKIKATWKAVKGAAGYAVYRADGSKGKYVKVKTIKDAKTRSFTDSGLKTGKTYVYKVRAYMRNAEGKLIYSACSKAVKLKATLAAPKTVKAKAGKSAVTLSWSKVKDADKYRIYRSAKKNGKYVMIGTTAKRAFTDKKVKKGKTYYYKVCGYEKVKNKVQLGACSAAKSAKAK